jgi:hypothetical protein
MRQVCARHAVLRVLENPRPACYIAIMEKPADLTAEPGDWADRLARSKAQIEAGQTSPLQPALDRLRRAADRLESGAAKLDGPGVTPLR